MLRPGGHFVFQMPEAAANTPADPPEDDTFEMRFYREQDLQQELEASGFRYDGCRRSRVHSAKLDFNQLRLKAQKPRS